jgi:hypothetical protein
VTPARWAAVAAAVGLVVALQLLAVLNPAVAELDPEEMYNAGHAWVLADGHWGALWRMQYREFCGGCTGTALLGAPLFMALPPSWLVWKLVPIGFTALLMGAGVVALLRRSGAPAAVAFALLVLFPPRAWLHLSLLAWGNHVECGVMGAVALLLATRGDRRSAFAAGVVLGIALWFSFSAAYAVVGVPVWLMVTGRWGQAAAVVAGVPLGLLPWLLRYVDTGLHPFVTIYESGEATPRLARIPAKIGTLVRPRQLVALFGLPQSLAGWTVGWAFAAAALVAGAVGLRRRAPLAAAPLALLGIWLAIYAVVRFQVWDPPSPEIAPPGSARYAAPIYPLLFLVVAAAVGALWASHRRWAVGLMALALPAGVAARLEALSDPFPRSQLARRVMVDEAQFTPQFSYSLTRSEHGDVAGEGPRSRALHAEALGWHDATDLLQDPDAPAFRLQPAPTLDPAAYGRGVGAALVQDRYRRPNPGLPVLANILRTLRASGLDAAAHEAAGAQAAWLLVQDEGSWLPEGVSLDAGALDSVRAAVAASPRAVAAPAWGAAGRAWAKAVTGDAVPSVISVPDGPTPAAFWYGLGRGAGEAWGPVAAAPRPSGDLDTAAFAAGYRAGLACCWLGEAAPPALTD